MSEAMSETLARLGDYMARREQQRADDVNALLERFTPRERSLMRDVAVLAFARGTMFRGAEAEYPKDSAVFADVLAAFLIQPSDACPAVLQGATYIEQGGVPDGGRP